MAMDTRMHEFPRKSFCVDSSKMIEDTEEEEEVLLL
jgi:hypothetical protein